MTDSDTRRLARIQEVVTALIERRIAASLGELDRALARWRQGEIGALEAHDAVVGHANHAEALVHSTEKALAEHGSKIGDGERRAIENAMADLKEALKGDDAGAITAKTNALAQASMKLGEAMYKQAQEGAAAAGGSGAAPGGSSDAKKEDVVDAEFTEVDDDKKNKKSA